MACIAFLPATVSADCQGPPSSPVLKIDIQQCEVASQFSNTLKITGTARQVLTMHYSHATESGNIEFTPQDNPLSEQSFWTNTAPGKGCKEFLEKPEELWLLADICNDTGQNLPNMQIAPLWPEIKLVALKKLEAQSPETE